MHLLAQFPFLIPLIVMLMSEMMKGIIEHFKTGTWHAALFQPGGMPSSHSAFVTSLLIIVAHKRGFESLEFAIAFVFAAVIWYDAMSLRRSVGQQAEALNKLQHKQHFSERVGHSFKEVIAGIAFGAAITQIGFWIS